MSEPFSRVNRRTRVSLRPGSQSCSLGKWLLIKFVWFLDCEGKRGFFHQRDRDKKHLTIYYPSADLCSSCSHDRLSTHTNSPWQNTHKTHTKLLSQLWNITTRKGEIKLRFMGFLKWITGGFRPQFCNIHSDLQCSWALQISVFSVW